MSKFLRVCNELMESQPKRVVDIYQDKLDNIVLRKTAYDLGKLLREAYVNASLRYHQRFLDSMSTRIRSLLKQSGNIRLSIKQLSYIRDIALDDTNAKK